MQQNTFDYAILLCFFSQFHQTSVGITTIFIDPVQHPIWGSFHIAFVIILIVQLNLTTPNGYVDDPYFYIPWYILCHFSAKVVRWGKSCIATCQRRYGRIPFAHGPIQIRTIHRTHHLKSGYGNGVHGFCLGRSLHIRLTKAEIDVKIRVLCKCLFACKKAKG